MRLLVGYLLIAASAAVAASVSDETDEEKAGEQTFTLPPGVPAEYSTAFTGEYKGTTTPTLSDIYEDNVGNVPNAAGQTFALPPGVPSEYSTISNGYKGTTSSVTASSAGAQNNAHATTNATDVSITLSLPSNGNFTLPPGVPGDYNTISSGYKGTSPSELQPGTTTTTTNSTGPGVGITLSRPSAQEPRQADTSCSDVLTATFFDENEEERDCIWLAEELARDFNRANLLYCGMMGARVLGGYRTPLAAVICPATCSLPCTYDASTCKDSSALVEPSSVLKKNKKCGWVKKNVQRIEKYCSVEEGVRTRADAACPKTCDKCGQLSASAMTEVPSSSPSAVPTVSAKPSSTPTMAPVTSVPSRRPSVVPTITESAAPSASPSANPSVTASAEPSVTVSSKPSVTASAIPSFVPTTSPSATPTVSHSPTAQPTTQPTRTPTSRPTYDLEQRAEDRNAQCGNSKIDTYDFQALKPIKAVCDVCVSSSECADAGDGSVRCCKWTWGQVCMRVAGIWSEAQVEKRCL